MAEISLYREIIPPPCIAADVLALWTAWLPANTAVNSTVIYADGSTDIVFRSSGRLNDPQEQRLLFVGPMDRPRTLDLTKSTFFVGARLSIGNSRILLDAAPQEVLNLEADVTNESSAFRTLAERLSAVKPGERLAVLAHELQERLASGGACVRPARIRRAVHLLAQGRSIAAIASELGITVRSLHREVLAWTGLPPKALARLIRFRKALRRIGDQTGRPLTSVAHEAGYADQAHMSREFREFAGVPPSALT